MSAQLAPLRAVPFDVVAVVTSAGGLDALSAVLADLPPDFAAAVLVGQHLGAESALADILARRVMLPVEWVREGAKLEPGRIYVGPPHMRLEVLPDRTCALAPFQRELLVEKPLDALLASVADSCGARGLAVVLTGMGRDGAAGARTLRTAGGAVIVQSTASAAYPEMPRAAAEAGAADLVLPLADIGRAVVDLMAGGRFPHPRNEAEAREALFAGTGEARAALRAVEWSGTPPGNVREWPQSLKTIVTTMLHSRFPTCIFWGPQFVQVYNDAWIAVLGTSHPAAAGVPARATWSEIWAGQVAGYRSVLQTGQASYAEDQLFEVRRHGYPEEAYFTVSHSPVHDDQGVVQGVMTIATETTERVLAARRQGALRALASAGGAETTAVACGKAADLLAEIPRDIPFALIYVCDVAQLRATLQAAVGLRGGAALAPHTIELSNGTAPWPLGKVLRQRSSLVLHDLAARLRGLHAGPWPEAPASAVLLPLFSDDDPGGVLVAGLSPRLPLDAACRDFLELLGRQMATNLAAARLRESERERIARLAELDRTRTEFFSNVSHEFRTPLTLILGPLEDLLAAPGPETRPLHRDLEVASRNARRLLNLVDTLLDFSQIEAGRLNARFRDIDLATHTSDIAGLFRSAAERARLQLDIDCPPLPGPVRVDPDMWEKIVSNLVSNALKFTFDGGIGVRLRHLGQHVQLEVEDTGVGIPQEQLPHVFQRFHRVRGTRARTEEGAGIGLALVHELVQLHHGRIRVRSEPGRGSTFTVWIPEIRERAASPQAEAASPRGRRAALQLAGEAERWSGTSRPDPGRQDVVESVLGPASTGLAAHVAGARLLVVDDNVDMRDYLARTLGGHWKITVAADGEQALRCARADPPDLVLADVMMPGLDGFGLLRELRADDRLRATPLVLVTARAHEEAAIEGLLAGADDYIAKPFSSRELVARVGAQLALARLRRQGERQVRELLSLVPVGVYACDTAGNFEYFNRTAVELWGREPARDDHWWAFCGAPRALRPDGGWLQPDDSPMAEVLRTGQPVRDRELTIVRADGARIELLLGIRPLHEEGRVVGAVCAFLDATARKQAERSLKLLNEELEERVGERTAALRGSEQRLALAFATLPVAIGTVDAAGNMVTMNEQMRRFLPTRIIPSRDPARMGRWRAWDAAGQPVRPEDFPAARALRGEDVSAGMQMLYLDDDGQEIWTEVRSASLRDDQAGITGALLLVIDVDRLKRNEVAARRGEDRLEAELRGTRLLSELGARAVGGADRQAVCQAVLEAAMALSGADAGTVQVMDESSQELVVVASRNIPQATLAHIGRTAAGPGTPCGAALASKRRAFADYEPDSPDPSLRVHAEAGLRSGQSTPMVASSGRIVGVVSTHTRSRGTPPQYVQSHLDLLARLASDLLESRHNAPLTGAGEKR